MKLQALLFSILLCFFSLLFNSCDKCTDTSNINICTDANGQGGPFQSFSVTYLDTPAPGGVNYIYHIYQLGNVEVSYSTNKSGPFLTIQEDFTDGKFGPYYFTCPQVGTQVGVVYTKYYKIKKDTFGTDLYTVRYLAQSDECHTYWALLEYSRNDSVMDGYTGLEKADVVIWDTLRP